MSRGSHGKDSVMLVVVLLLIACYITFTSIYDEHFLSDQQLFFGACIGVTCGLYVIIRFRTDPRFQMPMMQLTFYRVLAELGISIRFLFSSYIEKENTPLCEDQNHDCSAMSETHVVSCAPWSGLLHFFFIAAELWFLCIAFDFAVTLSNPFSPFKGRIKKYHIFCWGIALVTAFAVAFNHNLRGLWYASSQIDDTAICWISVTAGNITDINVNLWILFYIPLLVIYTYGVYVTFCAYSILSHGIQVTFVHRARVLFFSQLLLVIYLSYWAFLLALYVGLFISKSKNVWHWFLFFIPARGILGVLILFFTQFTKLFTSEVVNSSTSRRSKTGKFERLDLNSALQNEIVAYATVGIKESATLTEKLSALRVESDGPFTRGQHHFWIKVPEQLVQLENLKGIANVVDTEYNDIMQGLAESRSVARLKSLLYQQPDNVQYDARSSFSSTSEYESQSFSRISPKRSSRGNSTPLDPFTGLPKSGLTLQQLLPDEEMERHSMTNPRPSPNEGDDMMSGVSFHIRHWFTECFGYLKRKSIILNSQSNLVHFTEYSPAIFHELRLISGIEDNMYATSFDKPIKLHLNEGGASNALFFFSECRKYIAKSCTAEEMTNIRKHAEKLLEHFRTNRNSLLTRIFGAYKLQAYSTDLYFIVTNNVLLTDPSETITEKFDLKGSSVHRHMKLPRDGETVRCRLCGSAFVYNSKNHFRLERENWLEDSLLESVPDAFSDSRVSVGDSENDGITSPAQKRRVSRRLSKRASLDKLKEERKRTESTAQPGMVSDFSVTCPLFRHVPDAVLKDNDFRGKAKIRLPQKEADALVEQLYDDCAFLCDVYGVMDYSLLVGVYKKVIEIDAESNTPKTSGDDASKSNGINLQRGAYARIKAGEFVVDYSYYMGIIDYQQPYNLRKKFETWYKVNIGRDKREEISCIPPDEYKDRFLSFMEDLIF